MLHVDPARLHGLSLTELALLEKVFGRLEKGMTEDLDGIDGSLYAKTLQ